MPADDNPYRSPIAIPSESPAPAQPPSVLSVLFRHAALGVAGWMVFSVAANGLEPDNEPPWAIGGLGAAVFLASEVLNMSDARVVPLIARLPVTIVVFVSSLALCWVSDASSRWPVSPDLQNTRLGFLVELWWAFLALQLATGWAWSRFACRAAES